MSATEFDFAVFGSSPLPQLLASLLASQHGRRVVLIGESQAGYRLPRGIDLSVAPLTRPESWALLTGLLPETTRLLTRIGGRMAWGRVDPIFFARGQFHGEALSHVHHMAQGFGLAADPVPSSLLGADRRGVVMRDAIRINRAVLETGIDRWLERSGIRRIVPQRVEIATDGSATMVSGGASFSARQAVLAEDDPIMAWLPLRQWPSLFHRRQCASVLTTPTQALAANVMLELNSGSVLTQQAEGGIAAFGPGELSVFSDHLQTLLGQDRQVEQAGQTGFQTLETADGAPAVGRVAGVGADVVAGFGAAGAFFAPALARWLAGEASASEAAWFDARLVNRPRRGPAVDEYRPGRPGVAE